MSILHGYTFKMYAAAVRATLVRYTSIGKTVRLLTYSGSFHYTM